MIAEDRATFLVPAAAHELDRLDPEKILQVRLVLKHHLDHRLGLGRRLEELDHLVNVARDDRVEDHAEDITL